MLQSSDSPLLYILGRNYKPRKHDHSDAIGVLNTVFTEKPFLDPSSLALVRNKTGLSAFCIKSWFKQKRKTVGIKDAQKVDILLVNS